MRPIDADDILLRLDKRMTYEAGRNHAYLKGVRDAMKEIDAARTVDAIPVSWICDLIRQEENRKNYKMSEYLKSMVWEWHQEQGAK